MDDRKTREELLLEVQELRRQLAETRAVPQCGAEGSLGHLQGGAAEGQPLAESPEAEPAWSKTSNECGPELMARPEGPLKVLLIEDNPGDARLIREMLAEAGADDIRLEWVPRLSQGLESLGKGEIDLVLLDLSLPDSRGLETFCKAYTQAPEIPFVLLTGLDDETLALTAVQKGAQDYLIKGKTDASRLFRAIRYASERKKVQQTLRRNRDELEYRVEERTTEVRNYSEELRISSEELKIHGEELQVQNETLRAQAEELEDLTGELQNERNLFQTVLEQMPAGVIIAEPSGRIILTNRRAETIWQQPPDSLGDLEHFRQIPRFYPDGRSCPPDELPLGRALTLGETVMDEEHLLHRDDGDHLQAVHLNVSATPIRDRDGSIIAAVATYTDITARKQARAALRQSEERYRSLVELSPDAIVVHAKGKIVFVNLAAVQLLGAVVRSELVGQQIMDRIHPESHAAVQDRVKQIRAGATVGPLEEKVLRLDGKFVEVEGIGSAIMYQGRPAVQSILRDITERTRAREALREANEKVRAMIQASPLAIFQLDHEGAIREVNPAAERIFGWGAAELLGRVPPMAPEDHWEGVRGLIWRVWQGELLTGIEVRLQRKDGAWIDVSLSGAPMYGAAGEVIGIVGLAEEITARKQAEAALAKSRAEFEAIFNSISDAIIFADPERRIVLANPAVKTVFGYDPEELIGKSSEVLYADRADFEAVREKYYLPGQPVKPARFEITYHRKNGTWFSAESLAGQVKDGQGNLLGAVGIHRDITARKVAEAALKESQRHTAMLADFLENSSQPFAVAFLDGRMGMFNEAFLQLLGYSQKELSRLNWQKDLTPSGWREHEAAKLAELQHTGQPVRYEKEFERKDGSRVPVELFVHLRQDEPNRPVHYAFITDITARKKAEAALDQERQRLFDLLDALPAFVSLKGKDHTFRFANRRLREAFGETEGRLCHELIYEQQTPCEGCPVSTVIDTQTSCEWERTSNDGRTLQTYKYPFRDTDGTLCVLTLALDITARKKAEAALAQERQRLFDLLDALPAFVALYGENHTFRFANRRLREAFGETEGRFCYETFYGIQVPCEGCPMPTIINDHAINERERTTDDGRTLQIYQYPFRDTDGTPCVLTLALDISARKQAEDALKESEERFRQLAENIDDAILLASGDWQRVHYISPAYERIWGRSRASLYREPRSWLEGVAPEDLEEVKAALGKRMAGDFSGKEFPPFRVRRPDGAVRWISVRFFPIRNEAGETYRIAGIATDITERKEVEAVLRWREEHLRQTAKMEAVGRLAGGVAHDFNNLLTVISGYGELLLADLKEAEQGRQQVQAILKAADQATAVTRQLLAFSRKQVLQPQILDLNVLIHNLVEMFSRLVDENIKISTVLEPELGAVKADPSHMEQVIMNLVLNALDAMPQGGTLIAMTGNVEVTSKDSRRHPEIAPGNYVMVAVRDTGIGMGREVLSHIFEPFFTTKEKDKGTGLGLSMAYGIIKQSGGHILVESSPGKGSSFRIYLPRVGRVRKPVTSAAPAQPDGQSTGTILLVEDEEGVRHVVYRMLTLKGYSVLTAKDGQEALQMGRDHPDPIHLLLTDVAMPVMGGRELAEHLVPVHPEMRVLFMSGHTEDGVVTRGVKESVINFIQKPFRAEQLLSKVRELLAEPKPGTKPGATRR
ncbi:MAG: hybrid sensor histidine kinase/response regulator [Desulfobaccales bacterium]